MGINRKNENTISKPYDGIIKFFSLEKKQVQKCCQSINMN